jgi:hypothetical protein
MIVTVPLNLIISSSVVPVFVAMLIGAHCVVIVRTILRSILRADQRWGDTRHRNGGEYQQGRFPKMLTHGAILSDG